MKWQEVRSKYPEKWLLIEAIQAHSDSGKRYIDNLSVINDFDDSKNALFQYQKIKEQTPQKELYVFHTTNEELEIQEKKWHGLRFNI